MFSYVFLGYVLEYDVYTPIRDHSRERQPCLFLSIISTNTTENQNKQSTVQKPILDL